MDTGAESALRYPLKIVSDLHYKIAGGRLQSPADLLPIFSRFATVILNGDSVEQLLAGTRRTAQHVQEMVAAARSVGAELIFVSGNPDLGVQEFRLQHQDRLLCITHGDFGTARLHTTDCGALKRPFSYGWYFLKSLTWSRVYWQQAAIALQRAHDDEILVLGHTHRPSLTRQGRKLVVNLGAHMRGFRGASIEIQSPDSEIVFRTHTTQIL